MHELGIVTYVIDQVDAIMKQNDLTELESVTLEFGEVSGIEPEYLVDCWNWYAKKTPLIEHAQFLYETIPAITWCNACKKTYPTLKYGKTTYQFRIMRSAAPASTATGFSHSTSSPAFSASSARASCP